MPIEIVRVTRWLKEELNPPAWAIVVGEDKYSFSRTIRPVWGGPADARYAEDDPVTPMSWLEYWGDGTWTIDGHDHIENVDDEEVPGEVWAVIAFRKLTNAD